VAHDRGEVIQLGENGLSEHSAVIIRQAGLVLELGVAELYRAIFPDKLFWVNFLDDSSVYECKVASPCGERACHHPQLRRSVWLAPTAALCLAAGMIRA